MNEDIRAGLPSASKLERVAACPGSHLLEQDPQAKLADNVEEVDELAERGTRIHKARETGNLLELSAEETTIYNSGLEYERKLLQKWKDLWSFKDEDVKEGPRELRLWLHNHQLDPVGSGQLDVHFMCREYAICIDWKTGFCSNLVGATGNYQLRMQAVLLWLEHPHLKNIRVAFAKPLFENAELDYCDYSEMDLHYSYESIILALWWATQPDAVRSPGSHCRYCSAKTFCPQALAYAMLPSTMVKGVFSRKKPTEQVQAVSGDDLYRLWEAGSTIRSILDAVTARLKGMTPEELAQIALTLGPGRKSIQWDAKGALEYLRDVKLWPEEELWKCVDLGLGKLGKMAQTQLGVDEKYANESVKELLSKWITEVEGEKIIRKLR